MTSKALSNGILRAVGFLVGFALLIYFLYAIQSVIVYIAIAAVISLLGRPIIIFLRRRLKLANWLAVTLTMIVIFGLLFGIMALFIPLMIEQGQNLSLLNIKGLKANLVTLFKQINEYLALRDINLMQTIESSDWSSNLSLKSIPNLLNGVLGTLSSFGIGLFSVMFISFFFLKDSALLNNAILSLVKNKNESRVSNSITTIKNLLSRYFLGLTLQITVLFIIYTIILLIFGIDNALVIAFLCALLNLIPYIGPLIGGGLMLVLSMTSNLDMDFQTVILPTTIKVMIGYIIAQLIDNFVSQPIIFSSSVKSHPLEIFLVIIIAGLLFGVTGMVVAVPGYTALKVISKEFFNKYKIVQKLTHNL